MIVSWLHHILVKSCASYVILLSFSYLINLKIIKKISESGFEYFNEITWGNTYFSVWYTVGTQLIVHVYKYRHGSAASRLRGSL